MRTMMMTAMALLSTLGAVGQAQAHEACRGQGARLTMELTRVEQLNYSRPRDEFFVNIEHVIGMVRDRINDLSDDRRPAQQVLSMLDDGLYNIMQYNNNGRDRAPYVAAQTDIAVNRMRQQVRELQERVAGGGAPVYGPAPVYGQQPLYVPAPAPVATYYRPAPVYRAAPPPAPVYYNGRW